VNDRDCRRTCSVASSSRWRWPGRRRFRAACWATLLAAPACAFAQLAITTAADTQYEYNTNVFDLQSGYQVPGITNSRYGDSFVAYGGKLDATYLWSQQQFHALVEGTEYHYDRFSELTHNEYTLDGAWKWKLGRTLDGLFEVSRIRSMVSLYNLIQAQLALQTEQRETGKIGFQFVPDWRAEGSGYYREVQEPLLGAPNLSLRESMGQGAFKYTGTAGVTAGLSAGYLHGNFSGNVFDGITTAIAPAYHQTNVDLTATDIVTGLSTFTGQIGYSRRTSAASVVGGINSISGATGELDYKRALTAKTTAELDLSRQIYSYITNTGSAIASIGTLTLNWQATYKIGVAASYVFTYEQLPGQGDTPTGVDNGTQREDTFNYVSLGLDYEALPWLSLKPYVHYQDRTSKNFYGGNFDSTVVGVQFTLQWQHGVIPPPTPFQILSP
jgi:hypothetical protein